MSPRPTRGAARVVARVAGLFVLLVCCSSPADQTSSERAQAERRASPAASIDGTWIARRLPQLEYRGGPFVRLPRVVTVTFEGDDPALVSRLERFGNSITHTPWWRVLTEGHCVGDDDCIGEGRPGLAVRLREALPAEIHAVEISALLRREAMAGHLGALDPETLLLVYLPDGVALRDAVVERYCRDGPRAYHRALRFDDRVLGYAVLPRCRDEATLTGTSSHELLEMTLGPDPSRPGFAFVPRASASGFTAAGSESMDPCGFITGETTVDESGFVVRRAWSNRAAAQGHDPCVPVASPRAFVALVPDQPTVHLVNAGDEVTIQLAAAADRPVARWTVAAVDLTGSQAGDRYVEVELDRSEVGPGETATLRVTLRKLPPRRTCVVGIVSTLDGHSYLWPLAVLTG